MRVWLVFFSVCCFFSSASAYRVLEEVEAYGGRGFFIELPNGFQALVISNPDLKTSSGAVSLGVGSWEDPKEYPGMAHFVEHLLFLGSRGYPGESEYMRYIEEWGGACNARTLKDKTVFGFSIRGEALEGALDRLAHFFINPLFTESAINREKYAVHHEFEEHVENEFYRLWRVFEEIGDPNHPNSQFSCGNLESLDGVSREIAIAWFEKYYQPQGMKLALFSEKPIEELLALVEGCFAEVPYRGPLFVREEMGPLILDSCKGHMVHMNSAVRGRYLCLLWDVEPVFMEAEKRGVFALIEKALNHGYPNGFSGALLGEGLAQEVQAEFVKVERNHGIFQINVLLTPEGVWHCDKVVQRCFETLAFLREAEFPEKLLSKVEKPSFLSAHQEAMRVGECLIEEDTQRMEDPKRLIKDLLNAFTPRECLYFLIAPSKELQFAPTFTENWMRFVYHLHKIPEYTIQGWEKVGAHPGVGFPPQEEVGTPQMQEARQDKVLDPLFLVENRRARIRLMEPTGQMERVEAFFCLTTPFLGASLKSSGFYELLVERVREKVGEGVQFGVEEGKLCVFLSATKEFAKEHFRSFFGELVKKIASQSEFLRLQSKYLSKYGGDPDPIDYANQIKASCFADTTYYTEMELHRAIASLSYEEYQTYEKECLVGTFIEGAFFGSLTKQESLAFWEEIAPVFPLLEEGLEVSRESLTFTQEPQLFFYDTSRRGNAMLLACSSEESGERSYILQQIVQLILQGEFFNELRTVQQATYRPHNTIEFLGGHMCHVFSMQSASYHSWELLEKVDLFLESFSSRVEKCITQEQVDRIIHTLAFQFAGKKERDGDQFSRGIAHLKSISYQDVLRAVKTLFSAENRKKVAILVEGSGEKLAEEAVQEAGYAISSKERLASKRLSK